MVRQTGNTLINNRTWAQTVISGNQNKLQQNKQQKFQKFQTPQKNTQQFQQVKNYFENSNSILRPFQVNHVTTRSYPRAISSTQLQALQNEFQGMCNLYNAFTYFGKTSYSRFTSWIQYDSNCVMNVARCYSLKHKPVPNLIRPQQKKAIRNGTILQFIPKQNTRKNTPKKNQQQQQQKKWGKNQQSQWNENVAWGRNQPKQIRQPPKQQKQQQQSKQQQQIEDYQLQLRHQKQMKLLQKVQLKQQELLIKKQAEQTKKLLNYQRKHNHKTQPNQRQQQPHAHLSTELKQFQKVYKDTYNRVFQKVYYEQTQLQKLNQYKKKMNRQKLNLTPNHRIELTRQQNKLVGHDTTPYTLNQLYDAFNYFPKKSYSGNRAWKYVNINHTYFSVASFFSARHTPFVANNRPKINVTNGLPIYKFNTNPVTKKVINTYNFAKQGVRPQGNGTYFLHWNIGNTWTHYYRNPHRRY